MCLNKGKIAVIQNEHQYKVTQESPSIKQVVTWIAQLGGFLARNHNGFPGVKTLWRGLQRLHDIVST
nr:IS4 family transposase [Pleurocapsa sp. CCALA 161]